MTKQHFFTFLDSLLAEGSFNFINQNVIEKFMLQKIKNIIKQLNKEELLQLKTFIEQQIEEKYKKTLGKRENPRIKIEVMGTCVIEREKDLYLQEHKIATVDISATGILFRTSAEVHKEDLLDIEFRFPITGEKKVIDCQAVRIRDLKSVTGYKLEVGCKSMDKEAVKAYREMQCKLKKISMKYV